MTVNIKIRVPVYKLTSWETHDREGKITVSSDMETLSEGYENLKQQIDQLMSKINGQTRLAADLKSLEEEIVFKGHELASLNKRIEQATQRYQSLRLFLERLGIDPDSSRLTFDDRLLLKSATDEEEQKFD